MGASMSRMMDRADRGWPALALALACAGAMPGPVRANGSIALAGTMGDKVVLVVDGRTRVVSLGASVDGMRVRRGSDAQSVVLESGGVRRELALGAAPVRLVPPAAAGGAGGTLVLRPGPDSLYRAAGEINGRAVQGVVDTGATLVVLSQQVAESLGVDWRAGQAADVQTASGRGTGRRVRLAQVALGGLQAREVEAVVVEGQLPFVLYGNSFLKGFRMEAAQGRLTLSP